jgi:hypothetical protein
MDHGQENQATVDGFIDEFSFMIFGYNHGAGSAIAFGTSFLNAFMKRERAQVV